MYNSRNFLFTISYLCLCFIYLPLGASQYWSCDFKNEGFEVISDLDPEKCAEKDMFYDEGNTKKKCFPSCYEAVGMNETCGGTNIKCQPGLRCEKEIGMCVPDEKSCWMYHIMSISDKLWKPDCSPNGEWEPVQCKGELGNGRCFCYSAEGRRIFGEEWMEKAKNMTCACSRRRSELLKQGHKDVTFHCDNQGNYEPLQCNSGLCWCAESKTGQLTSAVMPEHMMKFLPCYDTNKAGEQYLRQCESQLFAQQKIMEEFKNHGTMESSFNFVTCDWDGTYGKYAIENDIVYCTLKDNSHAGTWSSEIVANLDRVVNCNCARDKVTFKEVGLSQNLKCSGNGNYNPVQSTTDGKFYCVDSDGYQSILPIEKEITDPKYCPQY